MHVGVYKEIYVSVFFGFYMLHRKKNSLTFWQKTENQQSEDLHQSCLKYTMEGYIQKIKCDSPGFTGSHNSLFHAVLSYMAK